MHGPLEKPVLIQPERIGFRNARDLVYWLLQVVSWGAYFWGQASGEVIFASVSWREAGTLWGIITLVNLGLTHAIRTVSKRYSWLALRPGALIQRAIIAGWIGAFIAYGVTITASLWVYETPIAPLLGAFYVKLPLGNQLFNQFVGTALIFCAWVSAYFAFATQRRRHDEDLRQTQISAALQAAELRLLKSQLNPHFLFNALNGVRALIADEPAKAQAAVTQLARTLRYTLAAGDTELVTLGREMEMVDDYLALESTRLADRLHVARDIDPQAANVRIPVMLLQSLVENAIKHGIAPLKRGGTLRISAHVVRDELRIDVENPRPAGGDAPVRSEGVGLMNSSKRLRLLFGPDATIHLDLSDPQRAIASVRLPA